MTIETCEICKRSNDEIRIVHTERFGTKQSLCTTHYYQKVRSGKFRRTLLSENEIFEKEEYLIVYLYDKKCNVVGETYVSKEHRDLIEKYKWSMKPDTKRDVKYAVSRNKSGKSIRLHVLIAKRILGDTPEGMSVDHLNRNGLDNRNENLAYKDQTDQNFNQKVRKDNLSGIRGVSYYKKMGYWISQMKYKDIRLYKNFRTKEEAVKKRKEWEFYLENKMFSKLREDA